MSSGFPGALDAFSTSHTDGVGEVVHAGTINDLADAVNKIEAEVGDHQGARTTVRPLFNVKEYGAVGDGSTDDTTAFTNCITEAMTAGGTVVIPPATYIVTSIQIPTSGVLRMQGLGHPEQVILQQMSGTGTGTDKPIIYANDAAHVYDLFIEGIYFKGAGQGVASFGSNIRLAIWGLAVENLVIRDCIITDFRDGGINVFPAGNGRIRIERNRCVNNGVTNGLNVINAQNGSNFFAFTGDCWVKDNYVENMPVAGICIGPFKHDDTTENRVIVSGNIVKTSTAWAGIVVETDVGRYVEITDNQVYDCVEGIGLEVGGNTFSDAPMINYVIIKGNIIDSKRRAGGVGINAQGSHVLVTDNIIRSTKNSIIVSNSQAANFAEGSLIVNNICEMFNGDDTIVDFGIILTNTKRCIVRSNVVRRATARVIGAQTVGAGGTLNVDSVAGWASSGNIRVKAAAHAYTAIAQATQTTPATITLTAGGTFADGDVVVVGGMGHGIGTNGTAEDLTIDGNQIYFAGSEGVYLSNSTRTQISKNRIINAGSQAGGTEAIFLDGSNVDTEVSGNRITDTLGASSTMAIGIDVNTGETRVALLDNLIEGTVSTPIYVPTPSALVIDHGNRTSATDPGDGAIANYLIYKAGSSYAAKSPTGLPSVSANADAAAVLQTCLNNIASTGGTIAFAPATTYTWGSVPTIPRNFASGGTVNQEWIRIIGNQAKITLSSGVRQFLGFNRQADYDTFQYVEIGGFIIDCANWPSSAGGLQSIIGCANNTIQSLQRVNFDTIWIHDIKGINIPTQKGGASNNANAGIWIEVSQAGVAEATNNYIRNILIERCRFEGGDTGICVAAVNSAGGSTPGLRVYGDNWVARDCWHSTNVTPTATFVGSNFQFGGLIASTQGGGPSTLVCERLYGYGSGDDGLETNGFEKIMVSDCVMEDSWNLGFYVTNFNYLNGVDTSSDARQNITYTRCEHRATNNLGPNQNYGWIIQPTHDIGVFSLVDCSYVSKSIVMGATLPLKLAVFHASANPGVVHKINIDRFHAAYDSVTNATATDNDLQCFVFSGPGPCELNVRDSGLTVNGARTGTGQIYIKPFKIFGQDYRINIDGWSIEDNITGRVADTTRSIEIGEAQYSGANAKIRGRIARLRWANTSSVDNSPRGVWVYASTTCTISEKLVCEHFDFSGMSNVSNEVFVADATNSAKVFARHIQWGSGAQKAPQSLTVPGVSATAQQYTGLYSGLAFVIGGTVSKVEVSPDNNADYQTVATSTTNGCSFWLENGWWYKITYTAAPTAKIFWQP